MKNGALKNFGKFTGKHMCQSSKKIFFTEHLWTTASALGNKSLDILPSNIA